MGGRVPAEVADLLRGPGGGRLLEQAAKIERFARRLATGKVTLLFDADAAGDEGAKGALWMLTQRGLDVRLGWSRATHGGKFVGRQPENVTGEEREQTIQPAVVRSRRVQVGAASNP